MPDPTDAEKNEAIALALQPERDGGLWKQCPVHGLWRYGKCPPCQGTGRVAVKLHEPEYTLRLVEAANRQTWWKWGSRRGCAGLVDLQLTSVRTPGYEVKPVARRIRDIIYTAIQEIRP